MDPKKEQLIVVVWAGLGRESVGAAELELIQQALLERFGVKGSESPASIARTLADHGARLEHPEILEADVRWRESKMFALFSPEELNLATLEDATAWVEKVGALQRQFESEKNPVAVEQLRTRVLQIRVELEAVATSPRVTNEQRELAAEVADWLMIWLQNPGIFADWLGLRRVTPDFLNRFEPQKST